MFKLINNIKCLLNQNLLNFKLKKTLTSTATTTTTKTKSNNDNTNNEIGDYDILYKRIELETRSADRGILDSYEKFILMSAKFLDISISRTWEPFRYIKRRTLLRAAFVKKKYRVQYEFRTYFRNIELKYLTGSTANTFLEYIERNLPEGIALKVMKEQIEILPEHLIPPASLLSEKKSKLSSSSSLSESESKTKTE